MDALLFLFLAFAAPAFVKFGVELVVFGQHRLELFRIGLGQVVAFNAIALEVVKVFFIYDLPVTHY